MDNSNDVNPRLVRLPEVMEIIGVSKETILLWMKKGSFPRPLLLGPRARAWRLDEIQRWMESRNRVAYKKA